MRPPGTQDRIPEISVEQEGRRASPPPHPHPHPRGVGGGRVQRPAAPPLLGLHPPADAEKVIRK